MTQVKLSTPTPNTRVALVTIEQAHDPDSAWIDEATIEQRVRLAWEHFRAHEIELARERKAEAASLKGGLPPSSKRGKSSRYIAEKVGMKQTSFQHASSVVELADRLQAKGETHKARKLLDLLNNVSVNAARRERDRILTELEDEAALQQEVNESL